MLRMSYLVPVLALFTLPVLARAQADANGPHGGAEFDHSSGIRAGSGSVRLATSLLTDSYIEAARQLISRNELPAPTVKKYAVEAAVTFSTRPPRSQVMTRVVTHEIHGAKSAEDAELRFVAWMKVEQAKHGGKLIDVVVAQSNVSIDWDAYLADPEVMSKVIAWIAKLAKDA